MKYAVVLVLAVGLARGAVIPALRVGGVDRFQTQDELGQYSYGYVDGPSAKTEIKTADGITRGGYSYVDPNGLLQSTSYVSDPVNGFRVAATNLPVGHPVAYAPYLAPAVAHVFPAPAVVAAPAFVGQVAAAAAPAVPAPAPAPAQEAAAPEAEAAPAAAPEAPKEAAPEAPKEAAPEADDTVAVEAAGTKAAAPEAAPEQDAAPAPAQEAAPVYPGPAPEPVQDTPEVAQARREHLAAVEDTKARNALYDSANQIVVGEALVQAAPLLPAPLLPAPVVAAPVTRTVVAAPAVAYHPVAPLHIASQYHAQDELGQYSFGYVGGPSAKHEVKTADGITTGGYSYVDANGLLQSATYVSDPVNGFRVAATNLPVQPAAQYLPETPEVAEAREKLLRAQAEAASKL